MKGSGLVTAVADRRAHAGTLLFTGDAPVPTPGSRPGSTPVGSVLWTTWTGHTYRYEPPAEAEPPLTAHELAVLAAARSRHWLDRTGAWADPADATAHGGDAPRDVRSRLRAIAGAVGVGTVVGASGGPGGPETVTGIESWEFSVRRDQRRHDPAAARAERRRGSACDPAAFTDECPF